jgi:hypothetical protein
MVHALDIAAIVIGKIIIVVGINTDVYMHITRKKFYHNMVANVKFNITRLCNKGAGIAQSV